MSPTTSPRDLALLLLLAAIWGSSYTLIKLALPTVPPVTVTAGRMIVAAAVMLVVIRLRGERLPSRLRDWAPYLVTGIIGNALPFTLINWGETRIDAGLAAILTGVMPLGTMLLAHVFISDERFTLRKGAGVAAGFAGLVVLVGADALAGLGAQVLAQLAVVGAALCYSASTVYARGLSRLSPTVMTAATMLTASAASVPVALVAEAPWRLEPGATAIAAIIVLGVGATAAGMLIFFVLVRSAGATLTALVNYLVPVMGVAWGWLVLAETPSLRALAALALILSGIAAINRRPRAARPPSP